MSYEFWFIVLFFVDFSNIIGNFVGAVKIFKEIPPPRHKITYNYTEKEHTFLYEVSTFYDMSQGANYRGHTCRELCDMDTLEEGICAAYAIYYFPAVDNSTTKQPEVNWCYLYNYVNTKEE